MITLEITEAHRGGLEQQVSITEHETMEEATQAADMLLRESIERDPTCVAAAYIEQGDADRERVATMRGAAAPWAVIGVGNDTNWADGDRYDTRAEAEEAAANMQAGHDQARADEMAEWGRCSNSGFTFRVVEAAR